MTRMPAIRPLLWWILLGLALILSLGIWWQHGRDDASNAAAELRDIPGFNEPWMGDYDGMLERRIIRVLVAYNKMYYFLDGGTQRGLTAELMREFEDYVNQREKAGHLEHHVVMIPVERDKLLPLLEQGYGDLAVANLTITPERLRKVDFSEPWLEDVREVLVTQASTQPFRAFADLAGRRVFLRESSSYFDSLRKLNQRLEEGDKEPLEIITVGEALEDSDLLEMVNAGLIPMTVIDEHKVRFWSQVFDNLRVHDQIPIRSGAQVGWAMRKESPRLAAVVNEFIRDHRKGTLTGNVLFNRYLRDNQWARAALEQPELEKMRPLVRLLQTYGDRYHIPWLMLGALGYQESRLDQSKRSAAGAIGIMQVLESTAADPNVNLPDIQDLETNIHAATKYLRFLTDRYFNQPEIDELNRILFALAAYNAGPARIASLREAAAERGMDPNRWFDQVERVAARKIGRETVQYVSNIYKYYVAYQLVVPKMLKNDELRQQILETEQALQLEESAEGR